MLRPILRAFITSSHAVSRVVTQHTQRRSSRNLGKHSLSVHFSCTLWYHFTQGMCLDYKVFALVGGGVTLVRYSTTENATQVFALMKISCRPIGNAIALALVAN